MYRPGGSYKRLSYLLTTYNSTSTNHVLTWSPLHSWGNPQRKQRQRRTSSCLRDGSKERKSLLPTSFVKGRERMGTGRDRRCHPLTATPNNQREETYPCRLLLPGPSSDSAHHTLGWTKDTDSVGTGTPKRSWRVTQNEWIENCAIKDEREGTHIRRQSQVFLPHPLTGRREWESQTKLDTSDVDWS